MEGPARPLGRHLRPQPVRIECPLGTERLSAVEDELRARAALDRDRCCGYFPALADTPGIHSDLPACRRFADELPSIALAGKVYSFNFLRLSSVQQSVDAAYHLDSDAASALTGDVATLADRQITRLLLNLSTESDRTLRYLDVDPCSVELRSEGSYVCAADAASLERFASSAAIPQRQGSSVAGLVFVSNLVLHSGVDGPSGHFLAAYGTEAGTATGGPG